MANLMVFEPFFGSIAMAGKIVDIAGGMGMRRERLFRKGFFGINQTDDGDRTEQKMY